MDVNLKDVPDHVRSLIKSKDWAAYSLRRVHAGAAWLDQNGPIEWRLRLMHIIEGRVSSRVNFTYNKDHPLSLAFIADKRFECERDEYRWVAVAEHFDFPEPTSNDALRGLGFLEEERRGEDALISKDVDVRFLNAAWQEMLGTFWRVGVVGLPRTFARPLN